MLSNGSGDYYARKDGTVWLPWFDTHEGTEQQIRVAYYEPTGILITLPWRNHTSEHPLRPNDMPVQGLRWAVADDLPPDHR